MLVQAGFGKTHAISSAMGEVMDAIYNQPITRYELDKLIVRTILSIFLMSSSVTWNTLEPKPERNRNGVIRAAIKPDI